MNNKCFLAIVAGALIASMIGWPISAQEAPTAGMTMAEALASGECDDGDTACLEDLMSAGVKSSGDQDSESEDGSSDDKSSKDDDSDSKDGKSDDGSSKDDDSDSKDGKSDDGSSKDDDSDSKDGKSDDGSSKDDDSDSKDGKSDDGSSKDDDSSSKDGRSDDGSSKDDDSDSKDGKSDDGSSKDDDSSSKDGRSDDGSSKDDDSSSDDDSGSNGGAGLPPLSIGNSQGVEFNNITQVPVSLSVTLAEAAASEVLVAWATEDGSANAGSDYLAASGTLSLAPGTMGATITVFIVGDDINEPTESFFVRLSSPVGATLLNELGEVVIIDDDDIDD